MANVKRRNQFFEKKKKSPKLRIELEPSHDLANNSADRCLVVVVLLLLRTLLDTNLHMNIIVTKKKKGGRRDERAKNQQMDLNGVYEQDPPERRFFYSLCADSESNP